MNVKSNLMHIFAAGNSNNDFISPKTMALESFPEQRAREYSTRTIFQKQRTI